MRWETDIRTHRPTRGAIVDAQPQKGGRRWTAEHTAFSCSWREKMANPKNRLRRIEAILTIGAFAVVAAGFVVARLLG
jgi:hypothetical protein